MTEILVNVTGSEIRVALVDTGVVREIHVQQHLRQTLTGNIYMGRVTRLLPAIQAAFVDIGLARPGFLHVKDLLENQGVAQAKLPDIRHVLHAGQKLVVQIDGDPRGQKGAHLTTCLGLPARYLVLTPGVFRLNMSAKITDENERKRLEELITPGEYGGYIFRTIAQGVSSELLHADQEFLDSQWREIMARQQTATAGERIYAELPLELRVLRDFADENTEIIRVDDHAVCERMQIFASNNMPHLAERIHYHVTPPALFDLHDTARALHRALLRKVSLKSGGYLVFDQTEAMTTIDVNTGTGATSGKQSPAATILNTNLEAVSLIASEVRLRNLGGIIIIDFIDMDDPLQSQTVLEELKRAFDGDSARTEFSELTRLGLVQMTRRRTRESLQHLLGVTCPTCQQRGWIKSAATVAYEAIRALESRLSDRSWEMFCLRVAPEVAAFLQENEPEWLEKLTTDTEKKIILQAEPHYTREQYDILPG